MNLEDELKQFTGTNDLYKHWIGLLYTDGVKYLADKAKAHWLIDAIASYQSEQKIKTEEFQVWILKVKDKSGVLTCQQDSDEPLLVEQEINYTDFPLPEIKLWVVNNVLLLPSEY